jgi:branched-chain amino acid aminotransferase
MASMRKMRMNIPMDYTLEFFQHLFSEKIIETEISNGIIQFSVYRNSDEKPLQKSDVSYFFKIEKIDDILSLQYPITMDLIKEIDVHNNIFSNIRTYPVSPRC